MKKIIISLCSLFCILSLTACGYQLRGSENYADKSVFAKDSTINIGTIEHSSIYPWVPFFIATTVRDEIAIRGLATWKSVGTSDYSIDATLYSFDLGAFDDIGADSDYISTADISLELSLRDNRTNTEIINSGIIHYSENYENPRETDAVRDVLANAIRHAIDTFYTAF